tara:strand:+ start:3215 stop:4138 length:924 start_codon:yes stop_codon:yes gene_type:complete
MSFIVAGVLAGAGAAIGAIGAGKAKRKAEAEQKAAKAELDKLKSAYKNIDTSNPYANLENQFAGLQNEFAGLENTMEDLTVNQQQAEFESQQFAQSQANILDSMRGAAGGSGIAATAQALASQGALQAQKASASIGQQEAANQMAAAQQAGKLQTQEAQGEMDVARQIAAGAAQVDQLKGQGQLASMQAEMQKQGTLMGMSQADATAAGQAATQAEADKWGAISGGVSSIAGALGSDRKLKENIKSIGKSPSGLKIYSFEYKDKSFGDGVFQGVMSDEVPSDAVVKHPAGYDMVDYTKLDVEFKNIN